MVGRLFFLFFLGKHLREEDMVAHKGLNRNITVS